jgi:hypothetical protein
MLSPAVTLEARLLGSALAAVERAVERAVMS